MLFLTGERTWADRSKRDYSGLSTNPTTHDVRTVFGGLRLASTRRSNLHYRGIADDGYFPFGSLFKTILAPQAGRKKIRGSFILGEPG